MHLRPLSILLAAALACPAAQAARYTYHGDLMDGDAPAEGAYDLRVRSFANPDASKALGEATELPGVALVEGRFSVGVDLPEDADGTTWVEVAVRRAGSNEAFERLGNPQPIAKVNSTCPGAWALDGNSGAPAGSFLGHADDRAVFVDAPRGVAVNSTTEPVPTIDLSLHAKSGGDADADLAWVSRNSRNAGIYLRDINGNFVQYAQSGGFEFFDGVSTAVQNNGLETFGFSGRLRSRAAGNGASDTSGGIWFDDERTYASFIGRGDNASNWTGIYEANGGWRFTAHDNGAFGFNTGTTSLDADTFSVNASGGVFINRPAMWVNSSEEDLESLIIGPKPDSSGNVLKVLQTRADGEMATGYFGVARGTTASDPMVLRIGVGGSFSIPANLQSINLGDRVGILRDAVSNALEVNGNASKSAAGDWLANSDRRIKTGIAPIPNALDIIMQLRPVTFRYDAAYRAGHRGLDDKRYYNVIAQEFANVFPEAVRGSGEYLAGRAKSPENEILQVDTYPAQITAIAAIQELAVQDDALRDEVAALKRDNAALRQQIDALLQRFARLEDRQER
jgi:hypothetical protein